MKSVFYVCVFAIACSTAKKNNGAASTSGSSAGGSTTGGSSSGTVDNRPVGTGATQSAALGVQGGTIALESTALAIPPGALPANVTITVTSATAAPPAQFASHSPVYQFGPDGTQFLNPVTIAFAYDASAVVPTVYWSNASGGYDALPTAIIDGKAVASVTHFSSGFVADAPADNPPAAAVTNVSGTNQTSYYVSGGTSAATPYDYSHDPPTVLVPNGDGTFTRIAGSGDASGNFSVAGVAPGTFYLQFDDNNFFIGDQRSFDFSTFAAQRPDTQQFANETDTTPLIALTLENSIGSPVPVPVPVSIASGHLEMYSPTNGAYAEYSAQYDTNWYSSTPPDPPAVTDVLQGTVGQDDDTITATQYNLTWNQLPNFGPQPQVSASEDELYFVQFAPPVGIDPALQANVVAYGAKLPAFDLTDATTDQTAQVSVDLSAAGTALDLNYQWKRSDFTSYLRTSDPRYGAWSTAFAVDAHPKTYGAGQYGASPDLFVTSLSCCTSAACGAACGAPFPATDVTFSHVTSINPFDSTWEPFTIANASGALFFSLPAQTGSSLEVNDVVATQGTLSVYPADGSDVGVSVSPVQNLKIDDKTGVSDQTISATPTIVWDAPAVVPTKTFGDHGEHYLIYKVEIFHLIVKANGNTRFELGSRGRPNFSFLTFSTAFAVPATVHQAAGDVATLVSGQPYLFVVTATASLDESVDFAKTPRVDPINEGYATLTSGLMTVK